MRKLILFICLLTLGQVAIAQDGEDPVVPKKHRAAVKKVETVIDTVVTVERKTTDADGAEAVMPIAIVKAMVDSAKSNDCGCIPHYNEKWYEHYGVLLVFSPMIVFGLLLLIVVLALRGFNIKDALTENITDKVIVPNEAYNDGRLAGMMASVGNSPAAMANLSAMFPPTIEVSNVTNADSKVLYRPSTSRLIAFVASMFLLVVALSMCCFFIYHYMSTGCPPDLSNMSSILVALGIVVAPYAVSKVAGSMKSKSDK